MTNRVVTTIEIPDGVVPDVEFSSAPQPEQALAAAFVAGTPDQQFPPFPAGASNPPNCRVHSKPMKAGRNGGWFCPTKVGDGWCQEKA